MSKIYRGQESLYAPEFLAHHPGFDLILCADAHQKFYHKSPSTGREIINCGPMLRLHADEMDHVPGFFFTNFLDELKWVNIPCRPSSEVLSRDHLDRANYVTNMLEKFTGEVQKGDEGMDIDFNSNLKRFIEQNRIGRGAVSIINEVMAGKDKRR